MCNCCFKHQRCRMSFRRRVKDFPGYPVARCGLRYVSRSVRGILAWDPEWELFSPISAPSAFLDKAWSDSIEPVGQLLKQK
jgi:hypothetical protein